MTPKYRAYFLSCGIHDPYTIAQLLATCSLRYLRMIHYGFDLMHVCYLCLLHFVAIQTFRLCRLNLISEVIKKSIFLLWLNELSDIWYICWRLIINFGNV